MGFVETRITRNIISGFDETCVLRHGKTSDVGKGIVAKGILVAVRKDRRRRVGFARCFVAAITLLVSCWFYS